MKTRLAKIIDFTPSHVPRFARSLRNDGARHRKPPVREIELSVQTWNDGRIGYAVTWCRYDFSRRRPVKQVRFSSSFYCSPTRASVRRVRRAQKLLLNLGATRTPPQKSVGISFTRSNEAPTPPQKSVGSIANHLSK